MDDRPPDTTTTVILRRAFFADEGPMHSAASESNRRHLISSVPLCALCGEAPPLATTKPRVV